MKAYFIGIGGIGASALARYYLALGWRVSGSDIASSEITDGLKKAGAEVFIYDQSGENLPQDCDLVVYSPAVPKDNLELIEANKLKAASHKLQILSYPQALGQITKKYKTIAVIGSHGKTTTTALLALIMMEAGLNPTVIVGANLEEFGNSNFRQGGSEYLLIEADEWQASFLNYKIWATVLTNIDREHLEYYGDLERIKEAFAKFLSKVSRDGFLILNKDEPNVLAAFKKSGWSGKKIYYSLDMAEAGLVKKSVRIHGSHNASNALGALSAARALGVSDKISLKAISKYRGAWRRMQTEDINIKGKKITLITDYAHHPTEIEATLKAAAEKYGPRKIWAIVQPHQYSRFWHLYPDFLKTLQKGFCQRLTLTDVYFVKGRDTEELRQKVLQDRSPQNLIDMLNTRYQIQGTKYEYRAFSLEKLGRIVREESLENEVVILMGAGDIHEIFSLLTSGNFG